MLKSYSIKNFKSYKEAAIPLSTVTFLLGANGSGKSNALEALRFISWLGQGKRLDDIEREFNSPNSSVRGKANHLFSFGSSTFAMDFAISQEKNYNLQISIQNFTSEGSAQETHLINQYECLKESSREIALYEIASKPSTHSDEITVQCDNFLSGRKKSHILCSNRQAIFYQLLSPSRFNSPRAQQEIPKAANMLREQFKKIVFLDPAPSQMRGYSHVSSDLIISENGANVSAILQNVCRDEDKKSKLLELIRSLPEQDIKDITFAETPFGDVMLALQETFGSETMVPAPLLSDGTLRCLAIAAALLGAEQNSLVVIEEIDNGIHPSRVKYLVEQIYIIAKERNIQLLATTHNPALMNAIPESEIQNILYCYRDTSDGSSKISRLGDLERYLEIALGEKIGEMATSEYLDRLLKDTTPIPERKAKQLKWLTEFRDSVLNE